MLFAYITVFLISFIINIPCGYLRETSPRFSFKWFLWIHASIPVIIYLRHILDVSNYAIPFTIFLAVLGQIWGGRLKKASQSIEEKESLEQISHLNLKPNVRVKDGDLLVALLNMGGPRSLGDVKDFQRRLFSDPLLIRFPLSFIFQKFFAWLLIKFRLKAVKKTYAFLGGRSPIYQSTTSQTDALREELKRRGHNVEVTFSFNYSPPFPKDTILKAKRAGKKCLLPLSLYPHYSKATTGSNIHYLQKEISMHYPQLHLLETLPYYLHDGYIQAFVDRILAEIRPDESVDDFYILFSAHGLPLYFLNEGDPYPFQIAKTVGKILGQLGRVNNWVLAYQSAVGPMQWLKPSTDEMIRALGRRGVKRLLMVPVAFVGDHIETICEIDHEYRKLAESFGIRDYRMSKAIETHPGFISALADTVEAVLDSAGCIQEHKKVKQFDRETITS